MKRILLALLLGICCAEANAQCYNGQCLPPSNSATLQIPQRTEDIDALTDVAESLMNITEEDALTLIARATVRVRMGNGCGSGCVVGRDSNGYALVLTNAHVAGTSRGNVCQLERWNTDGTREKGSGQIIASGYGRGLNVDYALLRCDAKFASDVTPIPLADRYPNPDNTILTYGCPRCEWPSMQIIDLVKEEGQVLTWYPKAISGRSGSAVVELTEKGPRVVGLLTWANDDKGMGQSTPFLLQAMRGRIQNSAEYHPCKVELQQNIADMITEKEEPKKESPKKEDEATTEPEDVVMENPIKMLVEWIQKLVVTSLLCLASFVMGLAFGRLSAKVGEN